MEETAGAKPSTCYNSKESKETVSTELGQPHKPDIKALCKHWCCCMNLVQLSWYKIEDQGHLDPARMGNACPALLPALSHCMSAWSTQGMKNPSTRQLGMLHLSQEGLLTHRVAFTGGCQDRKLHLGILSRRWERGIA